MNNTTISKVLQGLVLVHLSFSVWSGKKKLRPEDLKGAKSATRQTRLTRVQAHF